jgi:hypothetical protein
MSMWKDTIVLVGLALVAAATLPGCNGPVASDPGPPPDKRLAGPGDFRVLPDGRLVVDQPPEHK